MIAELDSLYIKMRPTKAVSRLISQFVFEGRPIPHRWRWTNYANLAILRSALHIPEAKQVRTPIFIIGTGRSGTTILSKVLSMHREIGFLNEPKLLWHVAYPEEDVIGSYSRGVAHYRLGAEQATQDVCRAVRRMYGFYLAVTGGHRVLDKYPEMIFRIPFVLAILPDAKFLLAVRNGADSVQSVAWWCKQYAKKGRNGEIYDWWGVNRRKWHLLVEQVVASDPAFEESLDDIRTLSRQVDMAAVEWIASMREGLRLIQSLPQQIHLVCYEDLVARPKETLSQILDFCELSPDETVFNYASGILSPVPPKDSVYLHSSIQDLFEETMRSVGYHTG